MQTIKQRNKMDLFHYILFWVCVVGLCLGSFFNVVILRSLSNESIVFPASKCPKCNHKLYFWHNIPVISYILLGGKCYFCKEKISIQYPLVELLTMLLFGISFVKFGIDIKTVFVLFWLSCFIIMTATDLKAKLVDCNIAIAMGLSGVIYNFVTGGVEALVSSLIGLVVGAIILELIARSGYLVAGERAMGEADTYVAAAIGAIVGKDILFVLAYALIASMIFIVPMFLYNQYKNDNKKTCILSVLFVLAMMVFKLLSQSYWALATLIVVGALLALSILKNIKQEENRNYLPYVPALAIGALYYIFFSVNF